MDKKVGRHLVITALHLSSELSSILPFLKQNVSSDEYLKIITAIASVAAEISIKIVNPIFSEHPEIKSELEADVEKYGKIL
jgi:hypothetical protein